MALNKGVAINIRLCNPASFNANFTLQFNEKCYRD